MSTRQRKKDLRTDKELWALVRYLDDSVLHTLLWDKKWGIKLGAVHIVKWKDGKKYEAKLLAVGSRQTIKNAQLHGGELIVEEESNKHTNVDEEGDDKHANVDEEGDDKYTNVDKEGDDKHANVDEEGDDKHANVDEEGDDKHTNVDKEGDDKHANVDEEGDDKHTNVDKEGDDKHANVDEEGDDKHTNVDDLLYYYRDQEESDSTLADDSSRDRNYEPEYSELHSEPDISEDKSIDYEPDISEDKSIDYEPEDSNPNVSEDGDPNVEEGNDEVAAESEVTVAVESNVLTAGEEEITVTADLAENPKVAVAVSKNRKGKRVWDRKAVCLYCNTSYSKLSKHLVARHSDEPKVSQLCNLKKGSRERKSFLQKLRNIGNHQHNDQVIKSNSGTLIPTRRPPIQRHPEEYTVCERCHGYFLRRDFYRHEKTCNAQSEQQQGGRIRRQGLSFMLMAVPDTASEGLKTNVLPKMKVDQVSLVVKNDKLILLYGSKLYQKHCQEKHLEVFISGKMRELGRFLLMARKESVAIRELQDCINVKHFPDVVAATHKLCGFDSKNGKFKIPSLAMKIGHALRFCAKALQGRAMIDNNEVLQKQANSFASLLAMEWASQVSTQALKTLYQEKWNSSGNTLPLAEDIVKVNKYLEEELNKWMLTLKQKPSKLAWEKLASATLTSIVLFNRRRSGEAQRLEITTYMNRSTKPLQTEVMKSLSEFEQKLTTCLTLVETRGKRGRKVPILLKENVKTAIDLLIQHRKTAGVHAENKYIFALTNCGSTNPMRSDKVLRDCAEQSGALSITTTKMRKHVASMTQLLNLEEGELEILANFMGHDLRTHRQYYRLPDNTLQLAKVSKLLLAAEKGKMHQFKGMTLDQIDIENIESGSEDEDSEESDAEVSPGPALTSVQPSTSQISSVKSSAYPENVTPSTSQDSRKPPSKKKGPFKTLSLSSGKEKTSKRRKTNPVAWTEEESKFVLDYFKTKMHLGEIPGKRDVLNCKTEAGELLKNREWVAIKSHVWNKLMKMGIKKKA